MGLPVGSSRDKSNTDARAPLDSRAPASCRRRRDPRRLSPVLYRARLSHFGPLLHCAVPAAAARRHRVASSATERIAERSFDRGESRAFDYGGAPACGGCRSGRAGNGRRIVRLVRTGLSCLSNGLYLVIWPLTCFPAPGSYWGELTDLGRRSTLELGAKLRSLYVDQLGFLPPTLDSASLPSVALRSTNMPRTIESLHQVVEGLFGKDHRDPATRVAFTVRGWLEEDLYPNTSCRRLRALDAASIAKAAEMNDPGLAELDPVLGHIVGGPLRVQSAPKANGILDTAYCCRAHGIKLPKELDDPNVLRKLEDAVVHEWCVPLSSNERQGSRSLEFEG